YIDYIYTLSGNNYNLDLAIKAVGMNDIVDVKSKNILLNWETNLTKKERNVKSEREKSTIYYKINDGDVDHLSETGDKKEVIAENLSWIAFKQHFFSAVLTNKDGFSNTELSSTFLTQDSLVKNYKASTELAFNKQQDAQYQLSFFFGPNKY